MRFAVISDIHANLVAFEAVIDGVGAVDQYWCLGDVVGYGPQPNECVERLLELDHVVIMGNHDAAAIGQVSAREFNTEARKAITWTAKQLSKTSIDYLKAAPEHLSHDEVLLVHGSPRDPIWEYITTPEQAAAAFAVATQPYIFVGHTHVPMVFVEDSEGNILDGVPGDGIMLHLASQRLLLNPGSVGQPRDGDPRAAYAIVDSDLRQVEFHRIDYDIGEAQRRMQDVGASEWLTARLAHGR